RLPLPDVGDRHGRADQPRLPHVGAPRDPGDPHVPERERRPLRRPWRHHPRRRRLPPRRQVPVKVIMSSFAALNGAYTSLTAQRIALEATGQNISNVNTPGYTRQRVSLEAITGGTQPTMTGTARGIGVRVTSIDRLGDVFLETKFRAQTASASRLDAMAGSWRLLETSVQEPGEKRSEEHTSELQSRENLVCRLPLEKKKQSNRE